MKVYSNCSTYEYQSDFVRRFVDQGRAEGEVKGRVEGRAQSVLELLEDRGVAVPDEVRARITACGDPAQLRAWLRRAVTVRNAADLFE